MVKYSYSNALSDNPTKRLAFMQAQRYWGERPFLDAKNACGMGEYQARGWVAWHHHMSLVMLAMLFMLGDCCIFVKNSYNHWLLIHWILATWWLIDTGIFLSG